MSPQQMAAITSPYSTTPLSPFLFTLSSNFYLLIYHCFPYITLTVNMLIIQLTEATVIKSRDFTYFCIFFWFWMNYKDYWYIVFYLYFFYVFIPLVSIIKLSVFPCVTFFYLLWFINSFSLLENLFDVWINFYFFPLISEYVHVSNKFSPLLYIHQHILQFINHLLKFFLHFIPFLHQCECVLICYARHFQK